MSGTIGRGAGTGFAPYVMTSLGYQQIVGPILSTGLTIPGYATIAVISVSGAAVRWRDDGFQPTSAIGMPIAIGGQLTYSGNLSAFQIIQMAATAVVDIAYYK